MKAKIKDLIRKVRSALFPALRRFWDGSGYYVSLAVLLVIFAAVAYSYRSGGISLKDEDSKAFNPTARQAMAYPQPSPSPIPTPEPGIRMPVNGEITGVYSPDELVWNQSLSQWQTHPGVDIASAQGTAVTACADGIVSAAYKDVLWGNTVEITHPDGTVSRYCPLVSLDIHTIGSHVRAGDILGSLDSPPPSESDMQPHLHFEIYKDSCPIKPVFDN